MVHNLNLRGILFIILLCLCVSLRGNNSRENIRFTPLTIQQGLPHNHIHSIYQDHKGFMWIATTSGLCLYDGYHIKTYTCQPEDSTTLSHSIVRKIFEDSKHRLWLATKNGICRYNRETDNFIRYTDSTVSSKSRGYSFIELSQGRLLASTSSGIYLYDESQDRFIPFLKAGKKLTPNLVHEFIKDSEGIIWCATSNGLLRLNPENLTQIHTDDNPELSKIMKHPFISSISMDVYRRIWIGTSDKGVYIYNPQDNNVRNINMQNGLSSNYVHCLLSDNSGKMWVGTEHGINIVSADMKTISLLSQGITGTSNLNDNAIYVLYKDHSENIWVGTFFGGVNIHFKGSENFTTYPYGFSDKHLSGKAVRQIIADTDHSLWIATEDGGLNHFDQQTQTFRHYRNKQDKIGVSYYNVHSLLKDKQENLWIGTFTGGISRYTPKSGKTTYYSPEHKNMNSNMIFCLLQDHEETIYAGAVNGLFRYSPQTDRFTIVDEPQLKGQFIYCMTEDSNGELWFGTRNAGLYRYHPQTHEWTRIREIDGLSKSIVCLFEDRQKNIWIGTNNEGLIFYDRERNTYNLYTTADGLPSNSIMAITQDHDGDIWFSTTTGLCRFNYSTGSITNYTENDGLPINQFNFTSAYKAHDGQLFFGTINGMIAFYPELLKEARSKLHVEITSFKIHGKEAGIGEDSPLAANITETHNIKLTHKQASSFSFDYTGLNFSHSRNIVYAIRLTGMDSEWQNVGHQRHILFSGLPAGDYKLCIKASYDGIHWDEQSVRCLDIIILPPFWLSWYAYVIYTLLLILAGWIAYRIVRTRLRLQMKLKTEHASKIQAEELNRQKITFFTNISHDLKTPLTLILAPLNKIISDKQLTPELKEKLKVVLRNAQRMQYLIDELMTFSKIEMKRLKISVQEGDVLNFIEEISHIFQIVANESSVNFITEITPSKNTPEVWFSPRKLERILYNLLSNAFKFTPAGGTITLSAYLHRTHDGETFLHLTVKDTGIGISSEYLDKIFENYYQVDKNDDKQGSGIGLALTKSLVSIHKGTIHVDSKPGEGTVFEVELNVSASAFSDDEKSPVKLDHTDINANKHPLLSTTDLLQEKLQEPILQIDGKYKILIVEDNRDMNDFIAGIFDGDYLVIQAFDGQEGHDKALIEVPDLVISDVMMPVMDGFEMTRKLKNNLLTSHIPIVLLTAKTGEENKVDGFCQGADVFIEKPFNAQSLELQIKNILTTKNNNIRRFNNSPEIDVTQITTNPRDEKFMNSLLELVMKNLDNDQFSVGDITSSLGISRSLLHIKLKSLTNFSVTEFIRNIRMREAREKLIAGMNVSEASYAVGISDPNYFTKCFKKQFGQTPSEFVKSIRKKQQ